MKNLLFSTVLLFVSSISLAQLYVKPTSGGVDSYIYVKDQILFVEQDLDLTLNPTASLQASVYLRNGSQLIQGASNTPNKGSGMISVYQNAPDSDQWTYNYWCSPIGNQNAGGNGVAGNKNGSIRRIFDIQDETLSNQTLITGAYDGIRVPLTISSRWIYIKPRGLEAEGDYIRVRDSHNIPPGMGFTMKGVGTTPVPVTGFEYDFRGRPNNGDIDIAVFDGEYTLTGNPYPSALDLNRVFYDPDNNEILQFKYWDEDKDANSHIYAQNAGGYGTWVPGLSNPDGNSTDGDFESGTYTPAVFSVWNSGGTTNGSGANGANYERRFAPIGQGILIEANGSGDGIVTLKNAHRRYKLEGDNSDFRFHEGGQTTNSDRAFSDASSEIDTRTPQLRINTEFGTSHIRQTVLLFSENSTDGFDRGQDGKSPMDATSEMYFPLGDMEVPYVINTLPFRREKQIPITIKLNEQAQVVIKTIEEVKFGSKIAYIWDSVAHTFQPFTGGEEATFTLPTGTYNNRFFIVFKTFSDRMMETQSQKDEIAKSVSFFQNNPVQQLEVTNPEGYDIKTANLFDMSGKLVYSEANPGNSNRLTFPTGNLSDGIYLVMLTTTEGVTIDYKITIHNR